MHARDWNILIIEPNKFEAQIMLDLLRNAGADKIKVVADSAAAIDVLEVVAANIVIASVEATPVDGVSWTRTFRRNLRVVNRKASIFLTSHAFSRSMAEDCRHAGVNALIGKPVSGKVLIATIQKVLATPRPFIDAAGYVGPCRRAGIVTAGPAQRRRKVDDRAVAAPVADENTLVGAVAELGKVVAAYLGASAGIDPCAAALKKVQAYAVNAGDGPLMRACAAFGLQLSAQGLRADAIKAALEACMAGVSDLAVTPVEETRRRDAMAEEVRQAVAKAAASRRAA